MVRTRKQAQDAQAASDPQAAEAVCSTASTPAVAVAVAVASPATEKKPSAKKSSIEKKPEKSSENTYDASKPKARRKPPKKDPKRPAKKAAKQAHKQEPIDSEVGEPSSKGKGVENSTDGDNRPAEGFRTKYLPLVNPTSRDPVIENTTNSEPPPTHAITTRRSTRQTDRLKALQASKVKTPLQPLKPTEGYGPQRATENGPEGARSREISEDLKAIAAQDQAKEESNGKGKAKDKVDSDVSTRQQEGVLRICRIGRQILIKNIEKALEDALEQTGGSSKVAGKKVPKGTKRKSDTSIEAEVSAQMLKKKRAPRSDKAKEKGKGKAKAKADTESEPGPREEPHEDEDKLAKRARKSPDV